MIISWPYHSKFRPKGTKHSNNFVPPILKCYLRGCQNKVFLSLYTLYLKKITSLHDTDLSTPFFCDMNGCFGSGNASLRSKDAKAQVPFRTCKDFKAGITEVCRQSFSSQGNSCIVGWVVMVRTSSTIHLTPNTIFTADKSWMRYSTNMKLFYYYLQEL